MKYDSIDVLLRLPMQKEHEETAGTEESEPPGWRISRIRHITATWPSSDRLQLCQSLRHACHAAIGLHGIARCGVSPPEPYVGFFFDELRDLLHLPPPDQRAKFSIILESFFGIDMIQRSTSETQSIAIEDTHIFPIDRLAELGHACVVWTQEIQPSLK